MHTTRLLNERFIHIHTRSHIEKTVRVHLREWSEKVFEKKNACGEHEMKKTAN